MGRFVHYLSVAPVIAALTACVFEQASSAKVNDQQSLKAVETVRTFIPEPDRMREGDVRAKPGSFAMGENTLFCTMGFTDPKVAEFLRPDVPQQHIDQPLLIMPRMTIEKRNLSPYLNGQPRIRGLRLAHPQFAIILSTCPDNGDNILITQHTMLTARGNPWRIVTTVRQGNRFWSTEFEREGIEDFPWDKIPIRNPQPVEAFAYDLGQITKEVDAFLIGE